MNSSTIMPTTPITGLSRLRVVVKATIACLLISGGVLLLTGLDRFRAPPPRVQLVTDLNGLTVYFLHEGQELVPRAPTRLIFTRGGVDVNAEKSRLLLADGTRRILPETAIVFADTRGNVTTTPGPVDLDLLQRFLDLRQTPPGDFREWLQRPEVRKDLQHVGLDLQKFWTPAP